MIFRDGDICDLLQRCENKKLVCFGAGYYLKWMCEIFESVGFWEKIDFIVDNSEEKQGTYFQHKDEAKLIVSPKDIFSMCGEELVIVVTTMHFEGIIGQMNGQSDLQEMQCYLYALVAAHPLRYEFPRHDGQKPLIPKVIHYCWFGGKPLPDRYKQYIETWRKHCPDYEIIEWNEGNYDIAKNQYMYQAYQAKKWGFVPDYARLDIIYQYGGIYLDTDVELVKSLDALLYHKAFCGMEAAGIIAAGLGFGAVEGFPLIKRWRDVYDEISFVNKDGSLNQTASPQYQTDVLVEAGLAKANQLQVINGIIIYPTDVLSPKNPHTHLLNITGNTHAIHHFDGTWLDSGMRDGKEQFTAQVIDFLNLVKENE